MTEGTALDALNQAMEAYRRRNPRKADELDEAMERGVVDEDPEADKLLPAEAGEHDPASASGQLLMVDDDPTTVDGNVITLGRADVELVIGVGVQRSRNARARGRPEPDGTPRDAEQTDISSSGAECAFARFLGVEWEPLVDASDRGRRSRDVGGYEVRQTVRADGRLIIKRRDPDDPPFVLVTGRVPTYIVRGWLRHAVDGKQDRYKFRGDGRPQWFVPQDDLEPWEQLLRT